MDSVGKISKVTKFAVTQEKKFQVKKTEAEGCLVCICLVAVFLSSCCSKHKQCHYAIYNKSVFTVSITLQSKYIFTVQMQKYFHKDI